MTGPLMTQYQYEFFLVSKMRYLTNGSKFLRTPANAPHVLELLAVTLEVEVVEEKEVEVVGAGEGEVVEVEEVEVVGAGEDKVVGAGEVEVVGAGEDEVVGAGEVEVVGAGEDEVVGAGEVEVVGAGEVEVVGAEEVEVFVVEVEVVGVEECEVVGVGEGDVAEEEERVERESCGEGRSEDSGEREGDFSVSEAAVSFDRGFTSGSNGKLMGKRFTSVRCFHGEPA
ncbi:unnamed protein product [Angiostrongylus costaricensis]|uniref:Uncharacterized protein n=1 Tax=Angiostrongylus costaricensis TaxID=334426 RepID=A0A158PH21_ANGCS|nr:unnamed protein product [Angiostrongylus costaricensis]